jgi:hypothetical protein
MPGPVIKISGFSGEQPRITPRLLPDTAAQSAIDVRLDDGALTPVRQDVLETTISGTDDIDTIYKFGATWLTWDTVVHASPGPVATERLYFTGDANPKMLVSGTTYDLKLPGPTGHLTAALVGSGSGDIVTRVYCYTLVTDFGEESEPAKVSNAVDWKPGQTVTLSGFDAGVVSRNITKQRIYRSQTGQTGTYFFLIAERNVSTSDFIDNVAVDAFQEALPSADFNMPPDGLQGLTALPNGFFAAFIGRQIFFSEPWQPHAWPVKYMVSVTDTIIGMAAIDDLLVVVTNGSPVLLRGSHPAAIAETKIRIKAACINERSIIDLGYAVAFASNDGLVRVGADGAVDVVSGNLFNRDDWLALSPSTMIAAQMSGRYVAFYDTLDSDGNRLAGALFFDMAGTPFMVRSSSIASAAWFDATNGGLYYVKSGTRDVYRLDAPAGVRKRMYWRSKPFFLPYDENMGAFRADSDPSAIGTDNSAIVQWLAETLAANAAAIAAGSIGGEWNSVEYNVVELNGDLLIKIPDEYRDENVLATVNGGQVTFNIYANDRKIASIGATDRVVRLPSGFLARKWEIEVVGTLPITQVVVAKSVDDLKENG